MTTKELITILNKLPENTVVKLDANFRLDENDVISCDVTQFNERKVL